LIVKRSFFSRNENTESIPLVKYQGSNKKTLIHQKSLVQGGKCVKKGQILADGAATVGGELILEKKILVAYMPWEGYNSQDAVLISERLIYEDIFTSFSIWRYEVKTYIINWFDTNNGSCFSMLRIHIYPQSRI
jgi:DNA-directed RNA polymerase subunit beta